MAHRRVRPNSCPGTGKFTRHVKLSPGEATIAAAPARLNGKSCPDLEARVEKRLARRSAAGGCADG